MKPEEVLENAVPGQYGPARIGGDEFAVVLLETEKTAGRQIADRITKRLAASREDPLLSVSIGMAVYPEDGQTVEALVQAADAGLYDMKHRRKPLPQAAPQPSPALDQMAQWAQYLVEIKDMERRLRRTS